MRASTYSSAWFQICLSRCIREVFTRAARRASCCSSSREGPITALHDTIKQLVWTDTSDTWKQVTKHSCKNKTCFIFSNDDPRKMSLYSNAPCQICIAAKAIKSHWSCNIYIVAGRDWRHIGQKLTAMHVLLEYCPALHAVQEVALASEASPIGHCQQSIFKTLWM